MSPQQHPAIEHRQPSTTTAYLRKEFSCAAPFVRKDKKIAIEEQDKTSPSDRGRSSTRRAATYAFPGHLTRGTQWFVRPKIGRSSADYRRERPSRMFKKSRHSGARPRCRVHPTSAIYFPSRLNPTWMREPGIQMHYLRVLLDSGSGATRHPGMTQRICEQPASTSLRSATLPPGTA